MSVDYPEVPQLNWPDKAGVLAGLEETAGLRQELGANYPRYHRFLADELERAGSRWPPHPNEWAAKNAVAGNNDDVQQHLAATDYHCTLIFAEILLRRCRADVLGIKPTARPFVDEFHRLMSAVDTDNEERLARHGDPGPSWSPPADDGPLKLASPLVDATNSATGR